MIKKVVAGIIFKNNKILINKKDVKKGESVLEVDIYA